MRLKTVDVSHLVVGGLIAAQRRGGVGGFELDMRRTRGVADCADGDDGRRIIDQHRGAGELGFFSPGSYWPIGMAGSASVIGVALAFGLWWMVAIGIALILGTVGGLVFEYHVSPRSE